MKKTKRVAAAFLAAITMMTSVSCITSSAVDRLPDFSKMSISQKYGYIISYADSRFLALGNQYNTYTDESKKIVEDITKHYEDDGPRYGEATDEEYQLAFDDILGALEKLEISRDYAYSTYENSLQEENYNNWYTDYEWNDFTTKRENLGKALIKNNSTEISDAYKALMVSFNTITCEYRVIGDVNRDGVVDVKDVTMVQQYLAGDINFTGAQKMLASVSEDYLHYEKLSVASVTGLQLHIAEVATEGTYEFHSSLIDADKYGRRYNFLINYRDIDVFHAIIYDNEIMFFDENETDYR